MPLKDTDEKKVKELNDKKKDRKSTAKQKDRNKMEKKINEQTCKYFIIQVNKVSMYQIKIHIFAMLL